MNVRIVRITLLFGSMVFSMGFIMNNVISDRTKEYQRTVDRLRNLNIIKQRILEGRVLQVTHASGQEYIFSNKSIIDRKETPKDTKVTPKSIIREDEVKTCKPKRAADRMENLFGGQFNRSLSPFVTLSSLRSASSTKYPLPFGFHGTERTARDVVGKLPDTDIPADIKKLPCRRCIVIGNGGLLKGSKLGSHIDQYDAVFRLNMAPIKGYESDVGTKTTVRAVYPESSNIGSNAYTQNWTLLVVPFKTNDLKWVDTIIEGRDLKKLKGFWATTVDFVPKPRKDLRLYNPEITSELSFNLIGMKLGKGSKNVPTTGAMVIMVAIRVCDEVSVAGFGYDMKRLDTPIHYYSSQKTKAILSSHTHDIDHETKFLHKLVEQGVINDITGGLRTKL